MKKYIGHQKPKREKATNRNMLHQLVKDSAGNVLRVLHHYKTMPKGDFKSVWDMLNEMPKPNSARQRKLRGE